MNNEWIIICKRVNKIIKENNLHDMKYFNFVMNHDQLFISFKVPGEFVPMTEDGKHVRIAERRIPVPVSESVALLGLFDNQNESSIVNHPDYSERLIPYRIWGMPDFIPSVSVEPIIQIATEHPEDDSAYPLRDIQYADILVDIEKDACIDDRKLYKARLAYIIGEYTYLLPYSQKKLLETNYEINFLFFAISHKKVELFPDNFHIQNMNANPERTSEITRRYKETFDMMQAEIKRLKEKTQNKMNTIILN